jgi:cell division protein FtsB
MKSMEGVRRVTNRMELIQGLRSKLLKARLTSIVLAAVVIALSLTVAVLYKDLKEAKATINNYQKIEVELNAEIKELESNLDDANAEIDRLNSFDNKINVAFELEDIVREAVGGIEPTTKTLRYQVKDTYSIVTNINIVDYVLDETTGEVVKVIEDNQDMYVVYVANGETAQELEHSIGKGYYTGSKGYTDIISDYVNTLLVRHDSK